MACGNNMVSRAGLQSAPTPVALPSGPGLLGPQQSAPPQAAAVWLEAQTAMERAERKAATAVTAAAAAEAVKEAQRALDQARRMRGPAKERTALIRELERKLGQVKQTAAGAMDAHQQAGRAASQREQGTIGRIDTADRLAGINLGVPAHRIQSASPARPAGPAPSRPQPAVGPSGSRREDLTAALPLPVPDDLVVTRVEQLSLEHPVAPADLKPGTAYVYGENVYVTDASGRPAYMHGIVRYTPDASRHDSIQGQVGRDGQAAAGDKFGKLVGGHIGGVSLGGYPSGPNLFAQSSNMNVSAFAGFERDFREMAKMGARVEYSVRLADDSPGDAVVSVLLLSYSIDGVDYGEFPLINEPHQFK